MKSRSALALLTLSASLAGCTTMAQEQARKTAEKSCAEDGKRFVETGTISEGGMFGTAGVKGECVDIDDAAMAPPVDPASAS